MHDVKVYGKITAVLGIPSTVQEHTKRPNSMELRKCFE